MTTPLVPLASNELFERPPIVPHNACHFCYMERESAAATNQSTELPRSRAARHTNKPRVQFVVFERAMRANV
jgi:hypothetical protein